MKKLALLTASATLCFAVRGDAPPSAGNGEAVIAATLRADGSTNTWTSADLQAALGLVNRKYWRDMETDQGRRQWHGDRIGQYVTTNDGQLVRIDLYRDGYAATNGARGAGRQIDPEAAAKAAMEAKRRADEMRAAWEAANLPPDLAALRAAQRTASATQSVTVVVHPD